MLGLSFAYADNWLTGNGLQDFRFLEQRYNSVYSIPDVTWNRSPSLNLTLRHNINSNLTFSGNAYFRYIRADTTNGDINSPSFGEPLYDLSAADIQALTAAGYSGFPVTGNAASDPFPYWLCMAQGLELADPSETCTGIITNTFTKQHNYGLSGQASWLVSHNHVTAGAGWDRSSMIFQQASQFGYLNSDRITITPIDAFADARGLARPHRYVQPVCHGHGESGQAADAHALRPLQPHFARQHRPPAGRRGGRVARFPRRSICICAPESGRWADLCRHSLRQFLCQL
jgi:hypothetical protein